MSTALRSSARATVSVPRDPDVTAAINARRNRGIKSTTVTPLSPTAPVEVKDMPVTKVAPSKESAKAKARKAAAERASAPKAPKAKVAKTPKAPKVKVVKPKMTGYDKRQDGTLSARDLTCLCGCGMATVTNDARFISGHDAKMRQTILTSSDDAAARADAIPAIVRPFFDNAETIAGLRLRAGKVVDVKASAKRSDDEDDSAE